MLLTLLLVVVVVVVLCVVHPNPRHTHLEHHVLLTLDAETHRPAETVVFHRNGMGLVRTFSDAHPAAEAEVPEEERADTDAPWRPCSYTWCPYRRLLVYTPTHVGEPTHIVFRESVEMPEHGLAGHQVTRGVWSHYLWRMQPVHAPTIVGCTLRFGDSSGTPVLPFDTLHVDAPDRVTCTSRSSTLRQARVTHHPMSYRAALPYMSHWACGLFIRGRPLHADGTAPPRAWKNATVRLNPTLTFADVQWRDTEGLFHVVRGVRVTHRTDASASR